VFRQRLLCQTVKFDDGVNADFTRDANNPFNMIDLSNYAVGDPNAGKQHKICAGQSRNHHPSTTCHGVSDRGCLRTDCDYMLAKHMTDFHKYEETKERVVPLSVLELHK